MKFGRTDSQGQPFFFSKVKDLHYFRHLFKLYDISLIKEYIQASLEIKTIDQFAVCSLHQDSVFFASQEAQIKANQQGESIVIRIGHAFPSSVKTFVSLNSFLLYQISKKTVLILEKLYFAQISFFNGMKCCQKLNFLQGCEVLSLNFNSFAYRRGEEVDSIYYLLSGQIKFFKELGENIYEIASLEKGRTFGLLQLKSKLKHRELYAKAGCNETQIVKIPTKLLERLCSQREITIQCLLANQKSQIYSALKTNRTERKSYTQQHSDRQRKIDGSSRILLEKRIKIFESSQRIKSQVIQNLVESKKILYRVKQLSSRMNHSSNKKSKDEIENINAIRRVNDKWKSNKDKCKFQKLSAKRDISTALSSCSLRGLLKYSSVQRFLGIQSPQCM